MSDARRTKGSGAGRVVAKATRCLVPIAALVSVGCAASDADAVYYAVQGKYSAARVLSPCPVTGLGGDRVEIAFVVAEYTTQAVVAIGRGEDTAGGSTAWRFDLRHDSVADIELPGTRPIRVTAAVATPAGVFLGTTEGLLSTTERTARAVDTFVGVHQGSGIAPVPSIVREACALLACDAEANLWVAGSRKASLGFDGFSGFLLLSATPSQWATHYAGKPLAQPCPRLLRWRAPCGAIAGDAVRSGVWAYGQGSDGRHVLVHVDPSMASPVPQQGPRSAVPQGGRVPVVAQPKMAAASDGRVWLAGDTLDGARLYVFDGKAFTDLTPAARVLRARRFTQLVTGPGHDLYASTDGVGVLVLDGTRWAPHPINDFLPTVEGTELKPASCMTLDSDGSLWVGTDNNVICWRPDEQP